MATLRALPPAAGLRARQEAAGGAFCAPRCGFVACTRTPEPATSRSGRLKPAAAAGRRMRVLVAASDRQVEDWEPLDTPRAPPARLPQPLPPLPPPPPLARSGMSDTAKAAAAAAAVLLLFAAFNNTRLWSPVLPVVDNGGVDMARVRNDGDMMVIDSSRYGKLAFEKDSRGNILFTDEAGILYLTTSKLGKPVVFRIGRVEDLNSPDALQATLTAIRVLGAAPTEEMIQQAVAESREAVRK